MIVVVWALATGMITGGVWAAILLRAHLRRTGGAIAELRYDLEERLQQLDGADQRIAELEQRLKHAELALLHQRDVEYLRPSAGPGHEE